MADTPAAAPTGAQGTAEGPPGPHRENVFTRKIGPLPMWVWLVIAAAAVLLYVVYSSSKKKGSGSGSSTGHQQGYGFGRGLLPEVIVEHLGGPPHAHHRHHRGGHHHRDHDHPGFNPGGPNDPYERGGDPEEAIALAADREKAARDPGPGAHDVPGINRRHMRGRPIPGELVQFKAAEKGATPSLQDVANHYDTDPEAIVQEAEGRGYPTSAAWKRYVHVHDWASPLPPATDLSILAHPR